MYSIAKCTALADTHTAHSHNLLCKLISVLGGKEEIINYQANGHQAEFCFIKL